MFLCRYCRTEQEATDIEYERLKVCLCPNCKMICCLDYCVAMQNGRWNGPGPDFPTEGFDYKQGDWEARDKAEQEAEEAYRLMGEAFSKAYAEMKAEYLRLGERIPVQVSVSVPQRGEQVLPKFSYAYILYFDMNGKFQGTEEDHSRPL